jgi:hypothetical protein
LIGIKSIGVEHTSSCDAIETGQRAFEWIEKVASSDQSAPQTSPKVADDPHRRQFIAEFRYRSCIGATLGGRLQRKRNSKCPRRL